MTATYSGNPNASTVDQVRFLIGDTNVASPYLQDEEILWLLSENVGVYRAGAAACRAIATKTGGTRGVSMKQIGDLRIEHGGGTRTISEGWTGLAKELERRALLEATPSYGGGSVSDKVTVEADTDRTQPSFRRGMLDSVEVGLQPGGPAGWSSTSP